MKKLIGLIVGLIVGIILLVSIAMDVPVGMQTISTIILIGAVIMFVISAALYCFVSLLWYLLTKALKPAVKIISAEIIRFKVKKFPYTYRTQVVDSAIDGAFGETQTIMVPGYYLFVSDKELKRNYYVEVSENAFAELKIQRPLGCRKVKLHFNKYFNIFSFFDHYEIESAMT